MKVISCKNENRKVLVSIPNRIILNRVCFSIIKGIVFLNFKPIRKLKYKAVKRIVKSIRGYKGLELVSVSTADDRNIKIFL